ncbi:PadR family transcriptional regulator [Cellulomonas xiejunii]|uniref:PadR family transcriptional regulator n=1 Tax=Cellulomonas xiejunii TaxID=2968083 RepID=A0ABY5KQB2_9CELL|nr:PadR family transcriptional regulator [Cellulomonas xiejunii]MCC2315043.1 PadR family transcriptional regulator [Cellulomonas xiejunii]MCC2321470.1 PadR family transcriptional regulator [Cellulomonas xiejunii]MCC2323378.1 PadR family transcriptional regulator [Cellulomonas xiejunii]UUI72043.1 PadR family transcriptional regulator [Cellulomonas xiejunii]
MSTSAWQRVSLPLLVLGTLDGAPRHGYGISQALVAAGLQPVKGGQLYPTLVRLEDDGLVESHWEEGGSGPARKVYRLTSTGRDRLRELRDEWSAFVAAVEHVTAGDGSH